MSNIYQLPVKTRNLNFYILKVFYILKYCFSKVDKHHEKIDVSMYVVCVYA